MKARTWAVSGVTIAILAHASLPAEGQVEKTSKQRADESRQGASRGRGQPVASILALGLCLPIAPATLGPADGTVERLLADASKASTWPQRFALMGQIQELERAQVEDFVSRVLCGDQNQRLLGSMAMERLTLEGNIDLWKVAIGDSSPEVRRIGCLNALIRPGFVTKEQRRKLLDDQDPFLRAGAAMATTNTDDLIPLLLDGSILVRAVIARRLGTISGEAKSPDLATRAGLDALLIDSSELVRANAILGARCTRYFPAPTLRGLVLDARPMLHLEELLHNEPECRDSRVQYGLQREFDWHTYLLHVLFLVSIDPPPTQLSLGIQDMSWRLSVGTLAAATLVESKDADAIRYLQLLMRADIKPDLRAQLTRILEQAKLQRHE